MSTQPTAYQADSQQQSNAAAFARAPSFNPGQVFPGAAPPSFQPQLGHGAKPNMPPPTMPYAPGGGRAALTASLKRPMQNMSGGSVSQTPNQTPMLRAPIPATGMANPANAGLQQPAKKKRRLADKNLHPGIQQIVPESKAYMDLLSFERKLDTTISRKRIEIQEALRKPQKIKKKLRIFVSHTFTPAENDGADGALPMWELRVEGRLLEDVEKQKMQSAEVATVPPAAAVASKPADTSGKPRRKFSSFFRSLVIKLDNELYGPENHLVEWHRSPATQETDGFQVKRYSLKNVKSVTCCIMLMLDYTPPHYKLDQRLAKLLGLPVGTKSDIFNHLWIYIKRNKLQDPNHPEWLNLDPHLSIIFNAPRIRMQDIAQRLQSLLYPPDPIMINHVITMDNNEGRKSHGYDVDVDVDDPAKAHMTSFFEGVNQTQEIQALDAKIYETVEAINQLRVNREFFMSFANDPQKFIARWIQSQTTDLKTMTDVIGVPEAERRSEHYQSDWSREAVHRYFFNKIQQRRLELEQVLNIK